MIEFNVQDMTCGHCASVIARAVKDLDAAARVDVDVAARRVRVWPAANSAPDDLARAIRDAGYTPVAAAQAA